MKLKLIVKSEWGQNEFLLNPGDALIAGRGPEAQISVPRQSVSIEHLKIFWTGTELRISDLSSSNGTFRMPQDSPFYEASFAPEYEDLELRLSKSLLTLSWSPETSTQATVQLTSTEMISPTLLRPGAVQKVEDTAALVSAARTVAPAPARVLERIQDGANQQVREVRAIQIDLISRAQARQSAVSIVLCLSGALAFLLSWFAAKWLFRGLITAPLSQLQSGGFKDLVIVLIGFWVRSPLWCLGICAAILVLLLAILRRVHNERFVWAKDLIATIHRSGFGPRMTPFGLGLALWFLAGTWPLFWPLITGVNVFNSIAPAVRVWTLNTAPRVEDRVKILNEISDPLVGSSLVYKQVFLVNRARALEECNGQGPRAPWEQKKVCLLLMAAVGIEAYEKLRPALMQELAARASILVVLDGVTRIVEVDGPDSTLIEFFFASLSSMGLEAEASDIQEILKIQEVDTILTTLRNLRRRVEGQLEYRFTKMDLPRLFYFQVPGPLESGI